MDKEIYAAPSSHYVMSGHLRMCAAPSPYCAWAQGNLCCTFTSLCLGTRKCVLLQFVVWAQGNLCCTFASLYLGTKKYLMLQHSCHPLLHDPPMYWTLSVVFV